MFTDTAFLHTLRSLNADRNRRTIWGLAAAAALLGLWVTWFLLMPVARYEVTDSARIEIDRAVHPIQSETSGRILVHRLEMGREVQAGEVLLELDATPERLLAREERARLGALPPQVQAIRDELAAMDRTEARERETMEVALAEGRARFAEADALATLAMQDAARLTALHEHKLVSDRDLAEAEVEARRRRSAAESLRLVVSRLESEQHAREAERDVTRKRLLGDISRLEGERTTASATVGRIEFEAERRLVRAPVAGRIGEAQVLRPGAYVRAGETLGAIVPDGVLRIVAEFPPPALGRVRPAQPAKLRLRGFPWAEYGVVQAVVAAVAGEIRDGHVRVELSVSARNAVRVPLQHGLPGSVEVEVEQVTPALLVFRAAGQFVSSTASQPLAAAP